MSGFSEDNPGNPGDRLRKDSRLIENQWQGQESALRAARMTDQEKLLGNFPPDGHVGRQGEQCAAKEGKANLLARGSMRGGW
ncbi:hypothetical protein BH24ACT16_BH24ACT16_16590 [soil metagenome]|jgi:hypothetical protein